MAILSVFATPFPMETFLVATGIVALAEMGDKTQLLALLLAARYRRPWPIVWGIFIATVVNHALAGALGHAVTRVQGPELLRWVLGASFIAMDVDGSPAAAPRLVWFGTTVLAVFLAEMGDKTQIATVALAARHPHWLAVVGGTTLGMMLANAPVVWFGDRLLRRLPVRAVHGVSALIFLALGVLAWLGWDN